MKDQEPGGWILRGAPEEWPKEVPGGWYITRAEKDGPWGLLNTRHRSGARKFASKEEAESFAVSLKLSVPEWANWNLWAEPV